MIRRNAVVGFSVGILGIAAAMGAGCAKDATAVNPPQIDTPGFPTQPTSIGPKPQFGPTHTEASPVPPISGGTLIIAKDGVTALASDPDRDQVYVADLTKGVSTTIALQAGDEPGRLVEDGAQRVHVVLRKSGALLTIDIATTKIIARQQVCAAPRGIAYDSGTDGILVACAGGELVKLPAAGGAAPSVVMVHGSETVNDLRDVVTFGGHVFVTRLRSAELLEVDALGRVVGPQTPPQSSGMVPAVAWRTVLTRDPISGSPQLAMVHQRARTEPVSVEPGGYGQSSGGDPSCESSIVESTVTRFGATAGETSQMPSPIIPSAVLPVDIAVSGDSSWMAVVAAGNGHTKSLPDIMLLDTNAMAMNGGGFGGCSPGPTATSPGQATAVAFDGRGRLIVQTREPASLSIINVPTASVTRQGGTGPSTLGIASQIVLSTVSREDTGHSIFHSNAGGFVACASCHAEGGDDGRTWTFTDSGARRTQSLRGTLEGTAPYHWDGNMKDLPMLSHEVFVKRMSGDELAGDQVGALEGFLFSMPVPAVSPAKDSAQIARGQALFNDANVGCNSCHTGPRLTNNATVDVGTGGQFQVPSLIGVGMRAPYLHTGNAVTLKDRFDASIGGGDQHGHTSQLSAAQIDDLVAFLGTL